MDEVTLIDTIAEHEALTRQYTMDKKPMPLYGQITRLTEYLGMKGKYWTKEEAAYLVNGIAPETVQYLLYGQAITHAMSFSGERITENTSLYFRRAKEVLDILNRDEMPAKITPVDFIAWCEIKRIDTGWITSGDEWRDYLAKHSTADAGVNHQDGAEPAGIKTIPANSNEFEYSGLLRIPKKVNTWFQVIDDMTRDFHRIKGKMPSEHQAWVKLWTAPPDDCGITTNTIKGEDCLIMPGVTALSRSAFSKRWKNYQISADKPQ